MRFLYALVVVRAWVNVFLFVGVHCSVSAALLKSCMSGVADCIGIFHSLPGGIGKLRSSSSLRYLFKPAKVRKFAYLYVCVCI